MKVCYFKGQMALVWRLLYDWRDVKRGSLHRELWVGWLRCSANILSQLANELEQDLKTGEVK